MKAKKILLVAGLATMGVNAFSQKLPVGKSINIIDSKSIKTEQVGNSALTGVNDSTFVNGIYIYNEMSTSKSGGRFFLNSFNQGGKNTFMIQDYNSNNEYQKNIASFQSETGYVGIGTNNPTSNLEVNGKLKFTDNGEINSNDSLHRILFRGTEKKMELRESGDIIFSAGSDIGQETGSMIIKSNGNVGVGTFNPTEKLEVNGNIIVNGNGADGPSYISGRKGPGGVLFLLNNSSLNDGPGLVLSNSNGNDGNISMTSYGKSGVVSFVNYVPNVHYKSLMALSYDEIKIGSDDFIANCTPKFHVYGKSQLDGNVAIGKIAPRDDYKLTVDGSILCEKIKVVTHAGADFVFEDGYSLKAINELESYVNSHKHLPDVPSANEMINDGLELTEMNILLLRKVEELTLYIIEQNKRIEKLENN